MRRENARAGNEGRYKGSRHDEFDQMEWREKTGSENLGEKKSMERKKGGGRGRARGRGEGRQGQGEGKRRVNKGAA